MNFSPVHWLFVMVLALCNSLCGQAQPVESPYIDSIKQLLVTTEVDSTRAYLQSELTYAYLNVNQDSAWKYTGVALATWPSPERQANAYTQYGRYYQNFEIHDSALHYYELATEVVKRHHLDHMRMIVGHNHSTQLIIGGKFDEAEKVITNVLHAAHDPQNVEMKASAYYNLALCQKKQDRYAQAIAYYDTALAIFNEMQHVAGIIASHNEIASIYRLLQENDHAVRHYRAGLYWAKKHNMSLLMTKLYHGLAIAHSRGGHQDSALHFETQSLAINESLNDSDFIFLNCVQLGTIMARKKDERASGRFFERAKQIGEAFRVSKARWGVYYRGYSEYLLAFNLLQEADTVLPYTLVLTRATSTPSKLYDCYVRLAELKSLQGKNDEAYAWMKRVLAYKDSIEPAALQDRVATLEARYWGQQQAQALELAQANELLATERADREAEAKEGVQTQRNVIIIAIIVIALLGMIIWKQKSRHRKVEVERRMAEIELKALRAQMNPHFLFNAMNAIQMLINMDDMAAANRYLAKFARLIRMILENSEKKTVALEDELILLELYIELEALRYKFTYEIKADEELDKFGTQVPSMVLQPFVENAIKHGLAKREEGARLSIVLTKGEAGIHCVIEDNGVGRSKTLKSKHLEHRSMGIRITNERLRLFQNQGGAGKEAAITDLLDEEGVPSGTRVELVLPTQP